MSDTAEIKANPMETQSALPPEETERLTTEIIAGLKTVFDPEIPADIYELGLIYNGEDEEVRSPGLDPVADRRYHALLFSSTAHLASVPGVGVVDVKVVWEPAWTPERMSDEARLVLNMW